MSTAHASHVAHHFDDAEQQYVSAELGMWVFLATEVLFFGGAFLAYSYYRFWYPNEFIAGSHHLDVMLGGINTAVLLTSSLTMVLAVNAAQTDRRGLLALYLFLTMLLGTTFLGVKAYEYHHKYVEGLVPGRNFNFAHAGERAEEDYTSLPTKKERKGQDAARATDNSLAVPKSVDSKSVELFYSLYFGMTGLHALHMVIGIAILGVLLVAALRGAFVGGHFTRIEMTGLYWHFVDIVWVFLFPLLYLIR
jgi:cytochrome c oxidase subunit 3